MDRLLAEHREQILKRAQDHGARAVEVFGSRTRGDARPDSDVDLMVTRETGRTLPDLIAIKQDVEELLGLGVDVLTPASVSPYLRDRVLQEGVPL